MNYLHTDIVTRLLILCYVVATSFTNTQAEVVEEPLEVETVEVAIEEPTVEEAEEPEEPLTEYEYPPYQDIPVCAYTEFSTFMDYRANGPHTAQWQYQLDAFTNEYGVRQTGEFWHMAVARNYNGVQDQFMLGDKLLVNFGGTVYPVLVAEWKGNTTCLHGDGSMFEQLVDTDVLVSYNGGDNLSQFQVPILSIQKIIN